MAQKARLISFPKAFALLQSILQGRVCGSSTQELKAYNGRLHYLTRQVTIEVAPSTTKVTLEIEPRWPEEGGSPPGPFVFEEGSSWAVLEARCGVPDGYYLHLIGGGETLSLELLREDLPRFWAWKLRP